MLIHNRIDSSKVNGPGNRAVIWTQGCLLACPECWNPLTHATEGPEDQRVSVGTLIEWILSRPGIDGVTWSGGEPMHQIPELITVMRCVKRARPDLSFGMFTGYYEAELAKGHFKFRNANGTWIEQDAPIGYSFWNAIKAEKLLDFAIAGRFTEALKTTALPMRSSDNQKLLLLSDRYTEGDFKKQGVEITIRPGGMDTITGFPVGVKL